MSQGKSKKVSGEINEKLDKLKRVRSVGRSINIELKMAFQSTNSLFSVFISLGAKWLIIHADLKN